MKEYAVQFIRVAAACKQLKRYPIANPVFVGACSVEGAQCEAATVLLTGRRRWTKQQYGWLAGMSEGCNTFSMVLRPYKLIVFKGES